MKLTIEISEVGLQQFLIARDQVMNDFGNNGCNDWILEDTPENRAFVRELYENDAEQLEVFEHQLKTKKPKGKLLCCDFEVFDHVIDKLKKAVEASRTT